MQDRNVQWPSRYQLVKVEGTDDIYDIIPAPGEVSEAGTLINKATLLKDATAALYGLTDAVPDDVLAKLANTALIGYEEIDNGNVVLESLSASQADALPAGIAYENAPVWNANTGTYDPPASGDAVSFNGGGGGQNTWAAILGQADIAYQLCPYAILNNDKSHYYKYNATISSGMTSFNAGVNKCGRDVQTESPNRLTDILGNTILNLPAVQIATGSYVGTGTYGASHPNELTFGFEPKLLIIGRDNYGVLSGGGNGGIMFINPSTQANRFDKTSGAIITWGTTISWYSTNSAQDQMNASFTYYYAALG